ncbi:MAG: MFS transporter [Pseudomonadota bacterium]
MDQRDARRATYFIMAVFFVQPMAFGAWLALIPHVKGELGLTKSELALALLGLPIALIIALQFAGRAVGQLGLRRLMQIAFLVQGFAAIPPLYAGSQAWLFVALLGFGFMVAFLEVGMNVYAGRLEIAADRLVMNRCHGFWALGLMTGSFLVVLSADVLSPIGVMAVISFSSALLGAFLSLRLPKIGGTDGEGALPRRRLSALPAALPLIGAFMFLNTLTEGAMADWAAVYVSERAPELAAEAGIGVTIFSGFMAAGRFMGDALKSWFGPVWLARGSATLALIGIACLVLPLPIGFAYVGFAFVGVGVAAGYPLGVSAVASLGETYQAANVAIMSTSALMGFLVGPPLIGFLADAIGLQSALAVLAPGLVVCLYLARWLRPKPMQPSTEKLA